MNFATFIFIPLVQLILISSYNSNCQTIEIERLHPFEKLNNVQGGIEKDKYYLISNFNHDCKDNIRKVQEFANKNIDKNYSDYETYTMLFYKKSVKTNEKFIESDEDIIEWLGDDLIFALTWNKGNFVKLFEYDKGKIITSNNIVEKEIKY